jgi:hypothetical protein
MLGLALFNGLTINQSWHIIHPFAQRGVAMEILIPILILVISLAIFFVLHRWVGKYPTPLPLSKDRKRSNESIQVC